VRSKTFAFTYCNFTLDSYMTERDVIE